MKRYPVSKSNYCINALALAKVFLFDRRQIKNFIDTQVNFQFKSNAVEIDTPDKIEDWWAMWFQNATINFTTNELRTSADQISQRNDTWISNNHEGIHKRLAAMVNDLKSHGAKQTYCVDTIDAAYSKVRFPVFSYNRLQGSKNRFLWPLDGYHSIGDHRFLSLHHRDKIPFVEKESKIFWRGKLNGQIKYENEQLTLVEYLSRIQNNDQTINQKDKEILSKFSRFKILDQFFEDPLFDIGLSPKDKKPYTTIPYLKPWFRPHVKFQNQLKFRYLLAIGGSDLATNFYRSMDSNSVVFKVKTPWEGFLDGQFQAWKHYIPIKNDLSDMIEKYNWCEENHAKCHQISQAAQKRTLLCKSELLRKEYLRKITKGYDSFYK